MASAGAASLQHAARSPSRCVTTRAMPSAAAVLMQRSSSYSAARRHVYGHGKPGEQLYADWIFEEADALKQQKQRGSAGGQQHARSHSLPPSSDERFSAREAQALMPLLALHSDAVFAEVGTSCRGRLPLNLALNVALKEVLTINPDLQLSVESSHLCAPILQAGLPLCPVTFICSDLQQFHFRGISHMLLHNHPGSGVDDATCRAVSARLASSPTFQLLITTAPLPFQTHLVHLGDASLNNRDGSSGGSVITGADARPGTHRSSSLPSWDTASIHLYSTSFAAAPIGTISSLYCHEGVCCLPSSVVHAIPRQACGTQPVRDAWVELPPLAAHTAAVQDLCSSSKGSSSSSSSAGGGSK